MVFDTGFSTGPKSFIKSNAETNPIWSSVGILGPSRAMKELKIINPDMAFCQRAQ